MLHLEQQAAELRHQAPTWWIDGEPRFHDFRPSEFPVTETCVLLRVECQGCAREFDVAVRARPNTGPNLAATPLNGDGNELAREMAELPHPPPHIGGCGCECIGGSLPGQPVAVLQAWMGGPLRRTRRIDLEGELPE